MTDEKYELHAEAIERRIIRFIEGELLGPELTVEVDDELLAGDLLDSVAVLRLAAFIEEDFQVSMRPADFVIENFKTVAVLAGLVRQRAASSQESPMID